MKGTWNQSDKKPHCDSFRSLGEEAISCLLPITTHGGGGLYAACGRRVWVIDALTNEQVKSFVVQPRTTSADNTTGSNKGKATPEIGAVHQMAQSGQLPVVV